MPQQRRLNNYQNRLAQLFFVTAVLLLSIPLMTTVDLVSTVLLYLPVLTFISSHLFYLIRQPLTDLIVSALFLGSVLFMTYQTEFKFVKWPQRQAQKAMVNPQLEKLLADRRIWVLGAHQQLYTHGSIGTSFFDWPLSKPYLDNLNYYDNLVFIRASVDRFKPEIILDYEFRWRQIIKHIPELEKDYQQIRPFVWQRKVEESSTDLSLQKN
jgi:hypothetical protein